MPGHAAPINGGRSVYYVHGIPPEPKKTRWDMCNLPANPWSDPTWLARFSLAHRRALECGC